MKRTLSAVGLAAVCLTAALGAAVAASRAKECRHSCVGVIAACVARNQDVGDFRRSCKAAVLKRCRQAGPGVCFSGISTSTTNTTTTNSANTSTTTTTLRFVDNGDGTVTDHQTGLIWEKKSTTCPGPHCVNNTFTWSASGTPPDGTAFTTFLNTLNGGGTGVGSCVSANGSTQSGGFDNDCDWRLPTIAELKAIVDPSAPGCGSGSPCIDPIFGPTQADFYWSSTTYAGLPVDAWFVNFNNGFGNGGNKTNSFFVRAVRGGS